MDRALGDDESPGDGRIAQPLGHQGQYVALARAEAFQALVLAGAGEQLRDDLGVDGGAPVRHPPQRVQELDGREIGGLNETRRTELRRERIGFVFQAYNLIPSLSIADNILLPLRLAGRAPDPDWLRTLVERVGLSDRLHHRPAELSGGQQQRAAVVRALVARPAVVFADEPTGALDLRSAHEVLDLLRDLVDALNQTVVMVTHDPAAAARAHRALVMADGRVVEALDKPTAPELARRLVALGEV